MNYEEIVLNRLRGAEDNRNASRCDRLMLKGESIERLPRNLLSGFGNLRKLKFRNCRIRTLDDGVFDLVPGLDELDLESNSLTEISAVVFSRLTRLWKLQLANNKIKEVHDDAFCTLTNLDYLGLHGNCLTNISSKLFRNQAKLKTLYFSINKIETVEANAFDNLPLLEKLYFNKNMLQRLPIGIFRNLRELRVLFLHDNFLTEIDADLFANLGNLDMLMLSHNRIQECHPDSFKDLKKLETLNLYDNKIRDLNNEFLFRSLTKLNDLNLPNNEIETIHPMAFSSMTNLEKLNLSKNRITEFTGESIFKNLTKLRVLNLQRNRIESIHPMAFSTLESLEELALGENQISHIDANMFSNLQRLNELNLSRNRLAEMSFAENVVSLKKLDLDQNLIEKFDLSKLTGLQRLSLFSNRLRSIEQEDLKNMSSLVRLFLFNNQIEHIDGRAFTDLVNLKELILSSNRIETLDNGIFENLRSLEKLYLYNNRLSSISSMHFHSLGRELRYLYLFGNRISSIDKDAFGSLVNLKILLLNKNKISTVDFLTAGSLKQLENLSISFNEIENMPEEHSMAQLKLLDLSSNKIERISENFFSNLSQIREVNLSSNLVQNIDTLQDMERHCTLLESVNLFSNELVISNYDDLAKLSIAFQKKVMSDDSSNRVDEHKLKQMFIQMDQWNLLDKFEKRTEQFFLNEFVDVFQHIPNCIRYSEIRQKLQMFTILIGGTQQNRNEIVNVIENLPPHMNLIMAPLLLDSSTRSIVLSDHQIFELVNEKSIKSYRKAISRYLANTPVVHPTVQPIAGNCGYTNKLAFFQDFNFGLNPDNSENSTLTCDFDEHELVAIVNKIRSNNKIATEEQCNQFLKRQLLKKLFFNDLKCLLGFDVVYESEVESINSMLRDSGMKYRVARQKMPQEETPLQIIFNSIQLMDLESRKIVPLETLNSSDKLKLHLLLLKRDSDLIKFNYSDFYQIFTILDFDSLCGLNEALIEELLILIQSVVVNKMKIQVIMTVSNPNLLSERVLPAVLEMYLDEDVDQIFLREYVREAAANNEHAYLEGIRTRIASTENQELRTRVDLLNQQNDELSATNQANARKNENLEIQLSTAVKDCEAYRAMTIQKEVTRPVQIVYQSENPLQPQSEISLKLNEHIRSMKSRSENLTPDDAKQFIKLLQDERKSWTGEAKEIICGCLMNLTVNLYTLSNHYVYELLQNFEDIAAYNGQPKVKITFDRSFILFGNNEKGFAIDDVKSICSLSNSQKNVVEHIGHKGIGFKSVFLCTDKPLVISRSPLWSFQFELKPEDLLSYLTPQYVEEDEYPDQLNEFIVANRDLTTLFYLPFKELYKEEYFEELVNTIDVNILLFTNKIEMIVIDDKVRNVEKRIRRELVCRGEDAYGDKKQIRISDAKLFVNDEHFQSYRVFNLYNLNGKDRSSEITVAFPLTVTDRTYPIYSVFPVYDLKLGFLISAYWRMVTNRETVNEHNVQNIELKQEIFKFVLHIFKIDEQIGADVIKYLPKVDLKVDFWWKSFVNGLIHTLKPFLEEKFQHKRLFDKKIDDMASVETFAAAALEIIREDSELVLDDYGIRKVSVADLLKLFEVESLVGWKAELKSAWWQSLFELLNVNMAKVKGNVLKYKIFLIDSTRQSIDISSVGHFLCSDVTLKSTCQGHSLRLVDFESNPEKSFLLDNAQIRDLTKETLMEIMLNDQLFEGLSKDVLRRDFHFIRRNHPIYEQIISNRPFTLLVPTTTGKVCYVEHAIMHMLFNIDLSSLVLLKNEINFIDCPLDDLQESLETEVFFLTLNRSSLPKISASVLEDKISMQDKTLSLLKPFWQFSEAQLELVKQIFDLVPDDFKQDVVPRLPIRVNNSIIMVSSLCLENNKCLKASNGFQIELNSRMAVEVAKLFGIKEVQTTSESTITAVEPELFDYIINAEFDDEPPNIMPPKPMHRPGVREFKVFSVENNTLNKEERGSLINSFEQRLDHLRRNPQEDSSLLREEYQDDQNKVDQVVNFEFKMNTGIKAELFFYLHLKDIFNNSLRLENCWISSLRSRVYPDSTNCSDAAGYDFVVDDNNMCLSERAQRCYIEVKGFANSWNGTFHITQNELNFKDRVTERRRTEDENVTYMIAIVENVADASRICISRIIDWLDNEMYLEEIGIDSYEYKFNRN